MESAMEHGEHCGYGPCVRFLDPEGMELLPKADVTVADLIKGNILAMHRAVGHGNAEEAARPYEILTVDGLEELAQGKPSSQAGTAGAATGEVVADAAEAEESEIAVHMRRIKPTPWKAPLLLALLIGTWYLVDAAAKWLFGW